MATRVRFKKDWGKSKAGQSKRVANSLVDALVKGGFADVEDGSAEAAEKKAVADHEAAKKQNAEVAAEREKKILEAGEKAPKETKKQRKAREKAEAKAKAEAEAAANK